MPIILNNSNITFDYKGSNFNIESVKSELYLKNTTYDNYINNMTTAINNNNFQSQVVISNISNIGNIVAYYNFSNNRNLGFDSNPLGEVKYHLTQTIQGNTGGYDNVNKIGIDGASFQSTNDGDMLEGKIPLKTIYDNSGTGISISLWYYKKSGTTYGNVNTIKLCEFYNSADTTKYFSISPGHTNSTLHNLNWSFSYTSGETYCSALGPQQTLDTWYHLVISVNKSGIIKTYLNGTNLNLVSGSTDGTIRTSTSSVYPLPQFPNTDTFRIHTTSASTSQFNGNIDEIYIFNKELSQNEVNVLYYNNVNSFPTAITPYIYKDDNKIYIVEIYKYLGSGNQTIYSKRFTTNTLCDILIVGGGGAGGNSMGGGGGAGGVVYTINQIFNTGVYTIGVGKGGVGLSLLTDGQGSVGIDQDGRDSYIQLNGTDVSMLMGSANQNLRGFGGGGGGVYFADATINGRNGGSGGGCSENNPGFGIRTAGTATQGNTMWNGVSYVAGGKNGRQNTTASPDYQGGGGGGAGIINSIDSTNGNDGVAINITGNNVIYAAGGGANQYQLNVILAIKGFGGSNGVGGTGRVIDSDGVYLREATSGIDGTGSGGGGNAYILNPDLPAGSGGSGIVIIKYIAETLPKIYTASDGITYIIETYEYLGSGNQTTYTKTFSQNTLCDILLVAGGGSGGNDRGGGGGGGGIIYSQNITLNGTYSINVGNGGIGATSGTTGGSGTRGTNGSDSSISGTGLTTLTAVGGGAGGSCASGRRDGISGGSGGGGSQFGGAGSGGSGTIGQGNSGGIGYEGGAAGGGGGASAVGTNASSTNAGNGGIGLSNLITGKAIIYGSGGGGGGSNGSGISGYNQIFGTGGTSSAGNGANVNINGFNATPSTGGGGGGAGLSNGVTTKGGNGGSGIVIIRYKLDPLASNNKLLTMDPVITSLVTPQRTPYIYTFKHKRGANTQEPYAISFDEDTLCDILIVGGGGSSGVATTTSREPGGGGGGGIVYMVNKTLKGTYNIIVGKGGENSNGYDSEIRDINNNLINFDSINLVGKGGGKGGTGAGGDVGSNGGSGGGGRHTSAGGAATQGNTFWDGTQYVQGGFNGSVGNPAGFAGNNGGGGGGASATALGCEGGHGRLVTITGFNQFYGGGGGAGGGAGGRAGGLGGGGSGRIGGEGAGVKGTNDIGGGGGAPYFTLDMWHPGGSGIVIIRVHHKIINKNVITFRHSEIGDESQTRHEFTFTKNTICDVLVVGGGGGGAANGGAGGGGGVVTFNDVNFSSGLYTILVGNGGRVVWNDNSDTKNNTDGINGNNSSIEGNGIIIRAAAGGGGGRYSSNSGPAPGSVRYINPITKLSAISQGGGGGSTFTTLPYTIDGRLSGSGGVTANTQLVAGAGGGAAPEGQYGRGRGSSITNSIATIGNGGRGIVSSISGIPFEYGSGGAGHRSNMTFADINGIATGGGGYAEIKDINNKTYFYSIFNGVPGSGGGGHPLSWGGSGIVILKIKSINEVFYYSPVIKNINNIINSSGYPYIPADTTDLVAWYKFDGNANDSNPTSTKHNFSTISGTISYGKDAILNKPYLNLIDGSTIRNTTLKFNNRAFTISYLQRLYNYDAGFQLDTYNGVTGGTNNVLVIGSRGQGAYYFAFHSNDLESGGKKSIEDINKWILMTYTYDNQRNRKMYRNAILFNSDVSSSDLISGTTGNLSLIGRGDICDMRVYDRALSQEEITLLYNGYLPNYFNINFPSNTIASVNNREEVQFKGSYDLILSQQPIPTEPSTLTTQLSQYILPISTYGSSLIPRENQVLFKPYTFVTFTEERLYPPVRTFTENTTFVSNQSYGNGLYVITSSSQTSDATDYGPYKIFGASFSVSETPLYTLSTGFYKGNVTFNNYSGEWIKIQLPVKIKLTKYKIESSGGEIDKAPSIYKIFASDDNINWVEVVNKNQALNTTSYGTSYAFEELVSGKEDYYNYFCIVVNKVIGNSSNATDMRIVELYIYGREYIGSSIDIKCNVFAPIKESTGAQWTYNNANTNVYHLGNVGIGTKNPQYSLDVDGNIFSSQGGYTLSSQTSWTTLSDRRIKTNIVKASYEKCLENVKNIELYRFNFKNDIVNTNDRTQLGFIAQEVQNVYPKAVEANQIYNSEIEGLLTLDTTQIKYNLYGAFKYLIDKVEILEKKLLFYEQNNSSNILKIDKNV